MSKENVAEGIVRQLQGAGFDAYFAGGCVRDRLRGEEPRDFDIATSASPEQVQALFTKTVPVGVQFGVVIVVENKLPFEVATFRSEGNYKDGRRPTDVKFASVEEDAQRRDFTVNGLYYDLKHKRVIDLVNGRQDIQARVIRTIGNPVQRFEEDHLRLMRAVRFAVQLGFRIDDETWRAVKKLSPLIAKVSAERIRDEFSKVLTSPDPERGVRLLDEAGLLKVFLPEVEVLKGVEQPMEYHPEGDVFIHTMMLLEGLKNSPIELAMGALLHDIAKPATFVRATDRIRFHGHDTLGAEMSEKICKRLAFSNEQTKLICELVAQHLRFKDAFQMRPATLKRFLSLPRFDLHLALHRLDCMASHKKLEAYDFVKAKYEEMLKEPPPPLKLVGGKDLIRLGMKPSPEFATILHAIEDQILEGSVKTKEQGIAWVKANYPGKAPKAKKVVAKKKSPPAKKSGTKKAVKKPVKKPTKTKATKKGKR